MEINIRATRLEISKNALAQNMAYIRKVSGAQHIFFAVKSNAYGHGLDIVAPAAVNAGADGLAVAIAEEALHLRSLGILAPILILGHTDPRYAQLCADASVITTVPSLAWLQTAVPYLRHGRKKLLVSLALDTGMNRIGIRTKSELTAAIEFLQTNRDVYQWHGLMTHFATADVSETAYFQMQLQRWHALVDDLAQLPPMIHVANSGATLYHTNEVPTDYVRVGSLGYGWEPSGKLITDGHDLQPIGQLYSELSFVKQIPAGEGISYGHAYITQADEWIGTIPMGYGDGLPIQLQGFEVLVGEMRCPIVGEIAMDQLMVRLPHEVPVGTKVTFIGATNNDQIDIWEIAHYCHLEPWNFMNLITSRVPRMLVN
ncbi:alanine racemase [Periweissella ghanensis]|uniref:Alanine racemase n=1 Tax=Periweissella ghanensis TaxID=467997 RepID=A0ABM8ZEP1_9LACO|nr:alanine racemase [Periweissella ghanensis]MCM0601310.1 alanine racemase [Periweissella ghanensis]CAH0419372.1 Lysine racemase [Periweissella ghanensis]